MTPNSSATHPTGFESAELEQHESASQAARRFYRPELDALRLVAFLLVFMHHSLPAEPGPGTAGLPGGLAQFLFDYTAACHFGMSLFFTLSAYLICELLLRERKVTGAVQMKQFEAQLAGQPWVQSCSATGMWSFKASLPPRWSSSGVSLSKNSSTYSLLGQSSTSIVEA